MYTYEVKLLQKYYTVKEVIELHVLEAETENEAEKKAIANFNFNPVSQEEAEVECEKATDEPEVLSIDEVESDEDEW